MPICYYCKYNIKEFGLNDDEPGDEYTVVPLNDENGGEVAVCEACTSERLTDV